MRGPYRYTYTGTIPDPGPLWEDKVWYRTDIGAKERTPLAYSYQKMFATSNIAKTFHWTGLDGSSYNGDNAVPWAQVQLPILLGPLATPLYNACVSKWYNKVRWQVQFGVDYAERKQLYKLLTPVLTGLRRPVKTLAKLVEKASRKTKGTQLTKKTLLRDIPGAYLAWHFGIDPLLRELHELQESFLKNRRTASFVTTQSRGDRFVDFTPRDPTVGYREYHLAMRYHHRLSAIVQEDESYSALIALDHFGLANPAAIAWELVPWSFVVDWFFNIGLWLETIQGVPGYTIRNGYQTRYMTLRGTTRTRLDRNTPPALRGYIGLSGYDISRSLMPTWPVSIVGYNPLTAWKSTSTRLLTTASLLSQQLARVLK